MRVKITIQGEILRVMVICFCECKITQEFLIENPEKRYDLEPKVCICQKCNKVYLFHQRRDSGVLMVEVSKVQ